MTVIEVSDLRKAYAGRTVVDGVSFSVAEGEIFGILGANGAGKTTTVEMVEGLRRRDGGSVRVLGLDPERARQALNEDIGVQLQHTELPDNLKVWEALELFSSFYRNPRDWRELLDEWGLGGYRHARFGKLSGGQRQRLIIALALVGDPRVAFLDELTTGLDPQARRETWELIRRMRDSGVTVVLVSHFMDEVEALCDRVAILRDGRVTALDSPAGLIARAGGGRTVSFRLKADAAARERALAAVRAAPGVTHVAAGDTRVDVSGRGDFATAVTAVLAGQEIGVSDLRIVDGTLDDAFRALMDEPQQKGIRS